MFDNIRITKVGIIEATVKLYTSGISLDRHTRPPSNNPRVPRNPSISIYLSRFHLARLSQVSPSPGFNQGSRFSSRTYTRFFFLFFSWSCWSRPKKRLRRRFEGRRNRKRERDPLSHRNRDAWKGFRLHSGIRRKRELTGERGNEVSFKMVRARALRGRLWMRINLHSDSAQDLFNSPPHQNGETMTAVHLRSSSSRFLSTVIPPPLSLIYIEEPAFEVAPGQAAINLHHPAGDRFDACLSHL